MSDSLMSDRPKYSIIIPIRNGDRYLKTTIRSVIDQQYLDYELIISNNHSSDNTEKYLQEITHPNVKKISPTTPLSMTDHWEWALSQAIGEWIIIVGVDDGLLPYFFELADVLTAYADTRNIRAIFTTRSYYFWQGCEIIYGDTAVSYSAKNEYKIRNSKIEALKVLVGTEETYFNLPQMYSNSIFRKELLDEARNRQSGTVFSSLTPDANLAAIACSLENKYLEAAIPLGWVGSSPNSNGFSHAVATMPKNPYLGASKKPEPAADFQKTNSTSSIAVHGLVRNYGLHSCGILFWESMLQSEKLQSWWLRRLLTSKLFKILIFSGVMLDNKKHNKSESQLALLKETIEFNKCSYKAVLFCTNVRCSKIYSILLTALIGFFTLPRRFAAKVKRILRGENSGWRRSQRVKFHIDWKYNPEMSLMKASEKAAALVNENKLIEQLARDMGV